MEFKLKDLITNKNDIVGHLFLHCIDDDFANANKYHNDEEYNVKTIDIQLLINGQDFDIRPWLENFREFYFKYIKQEAQKLVSEKLSDRYYEISDSLNTLKEKLDYIENNIDWDTHIIK